MSLEGTGKCHTVTLRRHAVMAAGKMAAPIEFAADLCIIKGAALMNASLSDKMKMPSKLF